MADEKISAPLETVPLEAPDVVVDLAPVLVTIPAPDPDPVPHPGGGTMPQPNLLQVAFTALCQALEPQLEDSLPDQMHCQEIQGWYANGNHVVSWAHAMHLLEQVLGQKLLP